VQVYPHGSTDTLPFATMGSGSLAAMSVFESKYKEGLTVSESMQHLLDLTMLAI
jgi:20S proteasome subunit beta 2